MPTLSDWILSYGAGMLTRAVRIISSIRVALLSYKAVSPKPNLPLPDAYEPPPPPSTRELGPPPPGFARYVDLDARGLGGLTTGPTGQLQPQRRDPNEVTCFKVRFFSRLISEFSSRHHFFHTFKCGEKGHYANHCRNRNVPGNRGGTERVRRYGED